MLSYLLFGVLASVALSQQLNLWPVIGILTIPVETEWNISGNYSYIAASYVKFIEAAGARAIPIPWDAPNITDYLKIVNGVLFTGGGTNLTYTSLGAVMTKGEDGGIVAPGGGLTPVGEAMNKIFSYIYQQNQNGNYYPLWGTCQGFEAIGILMSQNTSILSNVDGCVNVTKNNYFYANYTSKLYSGLPSDLKTKMTNANLSYFSHSLCLDSTVMQYNKLLKANMSAITYSTAPDGTIYISSFESPTMPIYGTQFHQEKSPFEWRPDFYLNISHTYDAIRLEQYLANFFVNECRKNFNQFNDALYDWMLIYNYNATIIPQSHFEQIYLFPNRKTGEVSTESNAEHFIEYGFLE
jgi:Predicted glutamine amidotransferases